MEAATKRLLREGAATLGVLLDDDQLARFDVYQRLLSTWNTRINLTTVTEPREVVERHFLDSLALVQLVRGRRTLVDVGSGAGFPGSVIAIALPELRVTCVESIRKKVAFLQTLGQQVAPTLEAVCARVEELRRTGRQFEVAVSRATWDPSQWLKEGAPLVAQGGLLIAMQAAEQPELIAPVGFRPLPPVAHEIGGSKRRLVPFERST